MKRRKWEVEAVFREWFMATGLGWLIEEMSVTDLSLPSDFTEEGGDPWRDAYIIKFKLADVLLADAATVAQMKHGVFDLSLRFFFHRGTMVIVRWD